jgi:hypothetical protein
LDRSKLQRQHESLTESEQEGHVTVTVRKWNGNTNCRD